MVVAVGVIVIAVAAFGLAKVLKGSSKPSGATAPTVAAQPPAQSQPAQPQPQSPTTPTNPSTQTTPSAQVSPNVRPVMWLGMEIASVSRGAAVVETVRPNSNGDQAGVEPGDLLVGVNNHAIGSPAGIAPAIKGLHSGDHVTLDINNGGNVLQVVATLASPPTAYP
jgi:S1-C subfamily serine protease